LSPKKKARSHRRGKQGGKQREARAWEGRGHRLSTKNREARVARGGNNTEQGKRKSCGVRTEPWKRDKYTEKGKHAWGGKSSDRDSKNARKTEKTDQPS